MKRYVLTKVIYAKNMFEAIKNEAKGEVVQVELGQECKPEADTKAIGYK